MDKFSTISFPIPTCSLSQYHYILYFRYIIFETTFFSFIYLFILGFLCLLKLLSGVNVFSNIKKVYFQVNGLIFRAVLRDLGPLISEQLTADCEEEKEEERRILIMQVPFSSLPTLSVPFCLSYHLGYSFSVRNVGAVNI